MYISFIPTVQNYIIMSLILLAIAVIFTTGDVIFSSLMLLWNLIYYIQRLTYCLQWHQTSITTRNVLPRTPSKRNTTKEISRGHHITYLILQDGKHGFPFRNCPPRVPNYFSSIEYVWMVFFLQWYLNSHDVLLLSHRFRARWIEYGKQLVCSVVILYWIGVLNWLIDWLIDWSCLEKIKFGFYHHLNN